MKYLSILLIAALLCGTTAKATIIYVKPNGTGTGASWSNALGNLQTALNNANTGDMIWVAAGTYVPATNGDRNVRFEMKNGVKIYGGFAGNETMLSQRDSTGTTNITILSGEIQGDMVDNNNSYNVVFANNVNNTAELNGFTIEKGFANGGQLVLKTSGGGICNVGGSALFKNLTIRDCHADTEGGGFVCINGSPQLTNVAFENNEAHKGGGFNCHNSSTTGGSGSPTLNNVVFDGNTGFFIGGGLYTYKADPVIINAAFVNNTATNYGGGASINSGNTVMTNAKFINNSTPTSMVTGTFGGAMLIDGTGSVELNNILIAGNTAKYGGGVSVNFSGPVTFNNLTISKNSATEEGNDIFYEGAVLNIQNSIIDSNINNESIDISSIATVVDLTITQSLLGGAFPTGVANGGNNILHTDPLFADAANDDYSLMPCSPAINAGNNSLIAAGITTDIAKDTRVYNAGTVDMGAYEYQGAQAQIAAITTQPVDVSVTAPNTATFSVTATGTSFQWQRSITNGIVWNKIAQNGNTNVLTINNVTSNMDGYMYRCIVSGCPAADTSHAATLTVIPAADVTTVNESDNLISIYPNPTTGHITLQLNGSNISDGKLTITDALGRTVENIAVLFDKGANKIDADLSAQPDGIYFVSLKIKNGTGSSVHTFNILKGSHK